jgi:predicted Zn-dependent protease
MLNTTGMKAMESQDATNDGDKVQGVSPRVYAFRRAMVTLLAFMVVWCGWQVVSPDRADAAQEATPVVTYTVRPGDTIWSYAQEVTPSDQNVSDTVDRLMSLNKLQSAELKPGQRIVVPQQS